MASGSEMARYESTLRQLVTDTSILNPYVSILFEFLNQLLDFLIR